MIKTSEYISLGHPDRIADYISSYLLDQYIKEDPDTKYAVEVQIKDKFVTLGGEVTSKHSFNDEQIKNYVKEAYRNIGYTKEYQKYWGQDNVVSDDELEITIHLSQQSPQINQGVIDGGWGDQGIFYGYARLERNRKTKINSLPDEQRYAIEFMENIVEACKSMDIKIGLDRKTQVTKEYLYSENDMDVHKFTFVAAIPCKNKDLSKIRKIAKEEAEDILSKYETGYSYEVIVNGTGSYIMHGSKGDTGTTGRKLAVNFYGGQAPIGGGSPWTKDGSKADLTLNLYARELANKYCIYHNSTKLHHVIVGLSCCIGQKWIKGQVQFFDKNDNQLCAPLAIKKEISSKELIEKYLLNTPIYSKLCENNLFLGDFKWEEI